MSTCDAARIGAGTPDRPEIRLPRRHPWWPLGTKQLSGSEMSCHTVKGVKGWDGFALGIVKE
jgi:hypothetical protein